MKKIILTFRGPLLFHMNFTITSLILPKKAAGVLVGIAMSL